MPEDKSEEGLLLESELPIQKYLHNQVSAKTRYQAVIPIHPRILKLLYDQRIDIEIAHSVDKRLKSSYNKGIEEFLAKLEEKDRNGLEEYIRYDDSWGLAYRPESGHGFYRFDFRGVSGINFAVIFSEEPVRVCTPNYLNSYTDKVVVERKQKEHPFILLLPGEKFHDFKDPERTFETPPDDLSADDFLYGGMHAFVSTGDVNPAQAFLAKIPVTQYLNALYQKALETQD